MLACETVVGRAKDARTRRRRPIQGCVAEADHAEALRKAVLPLRIQPIDSAQYAAKAPPVLRRVESIIWDETE